MGQRSPFWDTAEGNELAAPSRWPHPTSAVALFTSATTWRPPECPLTDEWMKMMSYLYLRGCVCTHVYMYRYTSHTFI